MIEPVPIRISFGYDATRGPRLVVCVNDWPTASQAAADGELRRSLERQGRWRRSRAPDALRHLHVMVPKAGGPRWDGLPPDFFELHACQIVHFTEQRVDFDDVDAVHDAIREAGKLAHFPGVDAVQIVTGDRRIGCRTFSDPRVVEAVCDLGAPLATLSGPDPTLVDALAWHSSAVLRAVLAAIDAILRDELERADRPRLDQIAEWSAGPSAAPVDEAWPTDPPF